MRRLFSGIQPTGLIHIGNYLGALKQWVALQRDYDAIYGIVDLHSLTVPQAPGAVREATLGTAVALLALGLDPARCSLMVQSHVPQHAELMWILTTVTPISRLKEMAQFKEKGRKQGKDVNAGLFSYPVLMAADILLYDTEVVPVGDDQVQHVELARLLARRFNNRYGETFVEPQAFVPETGARVMSLSDPSKKMSKSDVSKSYIGIFEEPEVIAQKIRGAVTDSGTTVSYDPKKKPALANLITIGALVSDEEPAAFASRFEGKSYAEFKTALAETLVKTFAPYREQYAKLTRQQDTVLLTLEQGADRAKELAEVKMAEVRKKVGLLH